MRRRGVLAGLIGSGLAACTGRLDQLATGERGTVVEIRSGETVVLDTGLVVRLAGIDTPNGREPWSEEARTALGGLTFGKAVTLLYGGARRDRYDRALAHVRRDDGRRWVQEDLLKAGAARVHTWPDNRALAAEMLRAEAVARSAGRGLWALPPYRVLLPSEMGPGSGFTLMEGRVARLTPDYAGTRLHFIEGGPGAVIRREGFSQAWLDDLPGRLVRLRGWISGGALRVDHPEAVEFLRS